MYASNVFFVSVGLVNPVLERNVKMKKLGMKAVNLSLALLLLVLMVGCDSRPKIEGLFGEKIGDVLDSSRCKYDSGIEGRPMASLRNPLVRFPIVESDDILAGYLVFTNENGVIEGLTFTTSALKRSVFKDWAKQVDQVREKVCLKYGEPDWEKSTKWKKAEGTDNVWFIDGRVLTVQNLQVDGVLSFSVHVFTYERAAENVADSYEKNMDEFRVKWEDDKLDLPSDYVRVVERKIKAKMEAKSKESDSYL